MTTLTHTGGPLETARHSSGGLDAVETTTANAHMATIKRFCMCAFTMLFVGGAVAGLIALKAAIHLWRIHY